MSREPSAGVPTVFEEVEGTALLARCELEGERSVEDGGVDSILKGNGFMAPKRLSQAASSCGSLGREPNACCTHGGVWAPTRSGGPVEKAGYCVSGVIIS